MARTIQAVLMLAVTTVVPQMDASPTVVDFRPQIPPGLDTYLPVPEGNPLTAAKVELGRRLFFDTTLSLDGSVACASCHRPEVAFTDGRQLAVGVLDRRGVRNAPTLVNRGYGRLHFWDGRAASLEEQALAPIENPDELGTSVEEVVARLRAAPDYVTSFHEVFSREVHRDDLASALASYVRTILAGDAPIDRYTMGDRDALSDEQRQGLAIFRGKANCTACHLGPNFTDEKFHNTGVAWRAEATGGAGVESGDLLDIGRFAVTGNEHDLGAFKTPTLREIPRTAPYMHDGSLVTLEDVIEFYDRGGNPNPHLDDELRPLGLTTREKQALLTFLRSLTGTVREGVRGEQ